MFLAEGRVYHGTIREDAPEKQEVDLDFPLFVRNRKGLSGGKHSPYLFPFFDELIVTYKQFGNFHQ